MAVLLLCQGGMCAMPHPTEALLVDPSAPLPGGTGGAGENSGHIPNTGGNGATKAALPEEAGNLTDGLIVL